MTPSAAPPSRTWLPLIQGSVFTALVLGWTLLALHLLNLVTSPCPQDLLTDSGGGRLLSWTLLPLGPVCSYEDGEGVELLRLGADWALVGWVAALGVATAFCLLYFHELRRNRRDR